MENRLSRLSCTLLLMAAIFSAARYIAVAVLTGTNGRDVYKVSLDIVGPFLPTMAAICLTGGAVLLMADSVLVYKNRKK